MGRQRLAKNRALPPNLYVNQAGYYYYRHPVNKTQKGLGKDRGNAILAAKDANAALAARERSPLVDWALGRTDYTLAGWLPVYRELWEEKTQPAASTLAGTKTLLTKLGASDFAKMRMRHIETAHVASYLDEYSKASGAAMARNMRSKLSDIFRWAETQGIIEVGKNPVTATFTPSNSVEFDGIKTTAEEQPAPAQVTPIDAARAPAPADEAMLRLGQINERLAPITLTADGLARLGFAHALTDKSAKLYRESDFQRICAALIRHVDRISQQARAA